jgi:hypothetical protein
MRRATFLLLAGSIFAALTPSVEAQSWRVFSSKQLHMRIKYPAGWKAAISALPGNRSVQVSKAGNPPYSLSITLISLRPSSKLAASVRKYVHSQLPGATSLACSHWTATRVGRSAALVTLQWPPTEGGVTLSQAIFLVQSKSHLYQIMETGYGSKPIRRLSSFPSVYAAMLKTWSPI